MKEVNRQEFLTESYIIINNLGVNIHCTCQYTTKKQNSGYLMSGLVNHTFLVDLQMMV